MILRLLSVVVVCSLAMGSCKTVPEGAADEQDFITKRLKVPDYDSLKAWLEVRVNRTTYNKWLQRLHKYDTTLTLSELHILYYAWIYHPKYNPYNQEVMRIFSLARMKIAGSQTGEVELIETMEELDKALKMDPFCLPCRYLHFMGFHIMGREEQARKVQKLIDKMAFVIRLSGMGTEESPIHVISPHHADGFLFISGLKSKKKRIELYNDSIYLYVVDLEKQKDSKVKKLVFDITPAVQWQQRQKKKQEDNKGGVARDR